VPNSNAILDTLQRVKVLAKRYRDLTGKPLGVTGEVAEFEAARILGLTLAPARQAGYDATEMTLDGSVKRLQIKGRALPRKYGSGQRIGSIDIRQSDWDTVLLVLIDNDDLEVFEIWEAPREKIEEEIGRPGSKARNIRHALAMANFKRAGRLRWPVGS